MAADLAMPFSPLYLERQKLKRSGSGCHDREHVLVLARALSSRQELFCQVPFLSRSLFCQETEKGPWAVQFVNMKGPLGSTISLEGSSGSCLAGEGSDKWMLLRGGIAA